MTALSPLLDYASPRPHTFMRLPAHSTLDMWVDDDCHLVITERLGGKRSAVGAIGFAGLVLGWLVFHACMEPMAIPILAPLFLVEAAAMAAVIHNTWRVTTLRAGGGKLSINFNAPFRRRHHEWPADRVMAVQTVEHGAVGESVSFDHILVTILDDRPLQLFVGHRWRELAEIALRVHHTLRLGEECSTGR